MNVMEVNHLKKDYGKIHAVQDITTELSGRCFNNQGKPDDSWISL